MTVNDVAALLQKPVSAIKSDVQGASPARSSPAAVHET